MKRRQMIWTIAGIFVLGWFFTLWSVQAAPSYDLRLVAGTPIPDFAREPLQLVEAVPSSTAGGP